MRPFQTYPMDHPPPFPDHAGLPLHPGMNVSAVRSFSGTALLGWSAVNFIPAALFYQLIHGSTALIYFIFIPLASVATWVVTLPFGLMTSRFKEWVAGGALGTVCSVLLCAGLLVRV